MQNHPNNCVCGCHEEHKDTLGDDLYDVIDLKEVICLNQNKPNCCLNALRPISEGLNEVQPLLESNQDDPDLLLRVPFDGFVRIKSVIIIGGEGEKAPTRVKLFVNQEQFDISMVTDALPTQTLELNPMQGVMLEYPTKITKFNNVASVTLGFNQNVGGEDCSTQIFFIGFRGEKLKQAQLKVVDAIYEAKPNLKDHETEEEQKGQSDVF